RNTSKGAPFRIWAKKLPDEPVLVFNVTVGCEFVNWRFNSSRQNTRSDAAAMATVSAQRPGRETTRKAISNENRIIERLEDFSSARMKSEGGGTLAEERLVCKPRQCD